MNKISIVNDVKKRLPSELDLNMIKHETIQSYKALIWNWIKLAKCCQRCSTVPCTFANYSFKNVLLIGNVVNCFFLRLWLMFDRISVSVSASAPKEYILTLSAYFRIRPKVAVTLSVIFRLRQPWRRISVGTENRSDHQIRWALLHGLITRPRSWRRPSYRSYQVNCMQTGKATCWARTPKNCFSCHTT